MSELERLKGLQERGYAVSNRELMLAKREDRIANLPEPQKPDPLYELIGQLIKEIKAQASAQSIATDKIVTQVVDSLKEGLRGLKPAVVAPKKKHFKITVTPVSKDGKKVYDLKEI